MKPSDLSKLTIEELGQLKDWMVPPSRKDELAKYRRNQRKSQVEAADQSYQDGLSTKPGEAFKGDPRGFVPQRESLDKSHSSSNGVSEIQIGPRGGRYRINNSGRKSYDV